MSCKTTRDGIKIFVKDVFYHLNEGKEEISPKTLLGASKPKSLGRISLDSFSQRTCTTYFRKE